LPDRFTDVRLARASTPGGAGGDIMSTTRKQVAKAPGLPEQFLTLCKNLDVEFKTPNGEPNDGPT
jgi:hypothetical protein